MGGLFRIHERLLVDAKTGTFIEPGDGAVNCLEGVSKSTIEILMKRGSISPVHAPELGDLPGWTTRSERLQEAGYDTIGFVLAKPDDVIEKTSRSDVRDWLRQNVERWQHEIKGYLGINGYTAPKRG